VGEGATTRMQLLKCVNITEAAERVGLRSGVPIPPPGKSKYYPAKAGRPSRLFITQRQIKHAQVEGVETGECDELEFVAHLRQLLLEVRNRISAQLLPPVERRRAVVSQRLARVFGMYCLGEFARFFQIRFRSLTPEKIGIRRVCQRSRNRLIQSAAHS